jgi:ATP-dependent DNA ligase
VLFCAWLGVAPADSRGRPFAERRERLEEIAAGWANSRFQTGMEERKTRATAALRLMPMTTTALRVTPAATTGLRVTPAATTALRVTPAATVGLRVTPAATAGLHLTPAATAELHLTPAATVGLRVTPAATVGLHLTPVTRDRAVAEDWFRRFEGAGLDGVMAKALAGPYTPDKRTMLKVKHERDCDCVVAGFRWHKVGGQTMVGSLLLGLYGAAGKLQHVGTCASFTEAKRKELAELLKPYRTSAEGHPWAAWGGANAEGSRMPGAKSRWTGTKDLSWELLRPELVVEVAYEHMQGDRFRHLAHFRRWREDRSPESCTYAQLEVVAAVELGEIFGGGQ